MSDPTYRKLRLVLGDQLHSGHSWFEQTDAEVLYLMMEIRPETDYVRHHIQKVTGFFGAMRRFSKTQAERGHTFRYFRIGDPTNLQDFQKNIEQLIEEFPSIEAVEYQEPDEYRLDVYFRECTSTLPVPMHRVSSEHFLTDRKELEEFFGDRSYLMERFYRMMRQKWEVLMNGKQPEGGDWNFDASNRKKLPKGIVLPVPYVFAHDLQALVREIEDAGVETIGKVDASQFEWPLDRTESLELLDVFCVELLPHFGDFQDAMTPGGWSLYHSRISFALNCKMLTPLEVIQRVESEYRTRKDEIDISQAEGFIRQILGWREYVRGIYWARMPEYAQHNFFDHQRALPVWFWTGETKMACLSDAIDQSLERAYAHHIQRLMLTGNFALLLGTHPDAVDAWYLGMYMDAIEWVEMPNARGMSQFADGGVMATKPYVSSANYIHKMSDHCRSCRYDPKVKTGPDACPFNALYWDFFDRNASVLRKNPRIGMAYRNLDRMEPTQRASLFEHAEWIRNNIDRL